jgi:hypothetical protein
MIICNQNPLRRIKGSAVCYVIFNMSFVNEFLKNINPY